MCPLLPNPYIIGRSTWWPSGFPSPCDKLELLKSAPKLVENSKILILHGTKISVVLNSMLVDLFHLMCDHYVEYANNNDGISPFESRGGTSLKLFPLESSDNLLFTSPIV